MRRVTLLLLAVGLLFTGCGGPAQPAEGLLVSHEVRIEPPAVHLVFVGDIMLDRIPGKAVAKGEDPFASFAATLQQADLAVGNFECVMATGGKKVPKAYNFRCDPAALGVLARYFSAVSVANNHSGDYGKEAFAEQLTLFRQGGLPYFGGGMNAAEAHTPLILERKGFRIALLGYDEVELRTYEAGPTTPGLAWGTDEQVVADIKAAREKADIVVVYPHWGLEYHREPSERQQALARKMIDAGADLVVGAHPHVTQTIERYREKLIVYSLGNFVFDDFMDVPPSLNEPSRTSWVLRVTFGREGIVAWDTRVARTDDMGIPRRVPNSASPCQPRGAKEMSVCRED